MDKKCMGLHRKRLTFYTYTNTRAVICTCDLWFVSAMRNVNPKFQVLETKLSYKK